MSDDILFGFYTAVDVQGQWVLSWSPQLSSAAASSSFAFKDVTK